MEKTIEFRADLGANKPGASLPFCAKTNYQCKLKRFCFFRKTSKSQNGFFV
jgi:hypothetical protein